MISHDNLTWSAHIMTVQTRIGTIFDENDRIVSYLPLSHIAGLQFDIINPIKLGGSVYFAKPDAL